MQNSLDQIVSLISTSKRLMHEQISADKKKKISFLKVNTLHFIKHKEPLMKDIADYLAITPPSATSLADTLIESGLVKRVSDSQDRRMISIVITAKGKIYLKKSTREIGKRLKKGLAVLTKAERKSLAGILSKIVKSLDNK